MHQTQYLKAYNQTRKAHMLNQMTATEVAQLIADHTHHFTEPLITKIYIVLILHSLTLAVNNIKI